MFSERGGEHFNVVVIKDVELRSNQIENIVSVMRKKTYSLEKNIKEKMLSLI